MFTGLVESLGVLVKRGGRPVARALVETSLGPLRLGESICVHGACLTVDRIARGGFECDISAETLERTTLGALPQGAQVHLERATPLGGRMGGHILLGHVDGIGRVVSRETIASSVRLALAIPAALERFLASKGSIGVDGVSLTVNRVGERRGDMFELDLMLVPHTLGRTLLGSLRPGDALNVEVDVLARYVARQLDLGAAATDHAEVPPQPRDPPPTGQPDEPILSALRAGGFL